MTNKYEYIIGLSHGLTLEECKQKTASFFLALFLQIYSVD